MDIYTYVVIPLLIFFARIMDVSLGTIRIIFTAKGYKYIAPVIGFFEILIWLMAIRQVMENLTNVWTYLAYAAGFSTGTFVGMIMEEKISVGHVTLRVITKHDAAELLKRLKELGYHATGIEAEGDGSKVKLILMVIRRSQAKGAVEIIKQYNPGAFYSIEDVRYSSERSLGRKLRKGK